MCGVAPGGFLLPARVAAEVCRVLDLREDVGRASVRLWGRLVPPLAGVATLGDAHCSIIPATAIHVASAWSQNIHTEIQYIECQKELLNQQMATCNTKKKKNFNHFKNPVSAINCLYCHPQDQPCHVAKKKCQQNLHNFSLRDKHQVFSKSRRFPAKWAWQINIQLRYPSYYIKTLPKTLFVCWNIRIPLDI